LGALAALVTARFVLRRGATPVRTSVALIGAFAAYQATIFVGAIGFGGTENFSAEIISGVAMNDAFWFAGLLALHIALIRVVPVLSEAGAAANSLVPDRT